MTRFLTRRIIQMLILFVVFLSFVWLLLQWMPGDVASALVLNPNIPPETADLLRQRLGLDEPLYVQYVTYITNFFRGDMGVSFTRYPQEVSSILWTALPRTLVLFLTATILAFWAGFKSGKLIAWGRGGSSEQAFIVGGVFFQTVFYPWFAIVMLWLFGFRLGIFPVGRFIDADEWRNTEFNANTVFGRMIWSVVLATVVYGVIRWAVPKLTADPFRQDRYRRIGFFAVLAILIGFWVLSPMRPFAGDILHHTILPVVTLGLIAFGATMLLTRSAMLETLGEDYILTARAKGLPDRVIRDRHAARNALLPVTTSLVLALAFVIGGGIVTETIFSWPGMGRIFLDAVQSSDIPLALGGLSIVGVLALVGHLVADILYSILDPRIRIT
jgi:peptide/nickel transport system permease protein